MPKRKRDEIGSSEENPNRSADRALRIQRLQLEGVLSHGAKSLFRALKIARGFERQKLGRRQKAAKQSKDDAETKRLEVEVTTLKKLDLPATAESHLYKSLTKIRSIVTSPAFPAWIGETVKASEPQKDVAYANVTARLWNSNPVRTAMHEVLEGVRVLLGLANADEGRKKRVRAKDLERDGAEKGRVKKEDGSDGQGDEPRQVEEVIANEGIASEDEEHDAGAQWEGCSDVFEDPNQYTSRLADSSSDEDSSKNDEEDQPMDRRRQSSFSPILSDSPPPTTSRPPKLAKARKPGTKPIPAPKSTTFLPSLTAGYWSNSESAASEIDSDAADVKPRTNRMGQQARRALWEKKFGHKANHLKKQTESRDRGWDARKGAQGGDDRGARGRGRGRGASAGGGRTQRSIRPANGKGASGANSDPLGARRGKITKAEATEGPLHPSWEAAKKRKEVKTMAAFEGKKIVFD